MTFETVDTRMFIIYSPKCLSSSRYSTKSLDTTVYEVLNEVIDGDDEIQPIKKDLESICFRNYYISSSLK